MTSLFLAADDLAAQQTFVECWLVVAMAAIGGSIGSFINVVVYRMPAGESIVHPGSRCPRCGHAIRGFDNIPVISWFVLRGRCRDCNGNISFRYPLVEAITAATFVILGVLEVLSGCDYLPRHVSGLAEPTSTMAAGIWCVYGYHLMLLCMLLCVTLINWDIKLVPWRLLAFGIIVGLVAPMPAAGIRPIGIEGASATSVLAPGVLAELWTGLVGLAAGVALGMFARADTGLGQMRGGAARNTVASVALIGTFLGWQAVSLVSCAAAATVVICFLVSVVFRLARKRCYALWPACLWAATLGFILGWRWLDDRFPGIVSQARWPAFGASCTLVVAISLLTRIRKPSETTVTDTQH